MIIAYLTKSRVCLKEMYLITFLFNSSPINEHGNWCHQRLVEARQKIPGNAGRFYNGEPVSGKQPCKRPPTSTITLKELQWRNLPYPIPTMNHFLWGIGRAGRWIGKIGNQSSDPQSSTEQANQKYDDQSSDPSKLVIHKDHQGRLSKATAITTTRIHMLAHGKVSPCGHPTDHRDC